MSDLFLFADIDYQTTLDDSAKTIKLGTLTEYFNGLFWIIAFRGRASLHRNELRRIKDDFQESLMDPFEFLYNKISSHLNLQHQSKHIMYQILSDIFPTHDHIQAQSIYEFAMEPTDTYNQLIKESFMDIVSPYKTAIWHRLPI